MILTLIQAEIFAFVSDYLGTLGMNRSSRFIYYLSGVIAVERGILIAAIKRPLASLFYCCDCKHSELLLSYMRFPDLSQK